MRQDEEPDSFTAIVTLIIGLVSVGVAIWIFTG